LRLAREQSNALVIGVDASIDALIDPSRRATRKRALPNALFVVADACAALRELHGRIDELRITLPWGSLLRLVLEGEREFTLAVAGGL
jgi:hypothetical protein